MCPASMREWGFVKLERINGGTLIYIKLLMKTITRTQKKYVSYNGLKPFKCPPSPTVCLKKYWD